MKTKIVKDIHDDMFDYEIEYKNGSYFVSKKLLQWGEPFSTFTKAVEFIDKHYEEFKSYLSANNIKTSVERDREFENIQNQLAQQRKINIIKEWMGESDGN